jgi:hypothetical protein
VAGVSAGRPKCVRVCCVSFSPICRTLHRLPEFLTALDDLKHRSRVGLLIDLLQDLDRLARRKDHVPRHAQPEDEQLGDPAENLLDSIE